MTHRRPAATTILLAALLPALILPIACRTTHHTTQPPTNHQYTYTPAELITHDSSAAFHTGALTPHSGQYTTRGVELHVGPDSAQYTSPNIRPQRPFDSAILSWNVDAPPPATFIVELRVRPIDGAWSPWLHIGDWGPDCPPADQRTTRAAAGRVNVDVFTASTPCAALQYRLRARAQHPRTLLLRRMTISLRTTVSAGRSPGEHSAAADHPANLPLTLAVPFRNQITKRPELAGRICNPASVAMLLAYHGINTPVEEVARLCHDPVHDIYGGWPRAVQAAHTLGLSGYIEHISDWHRVHQHLSAGRPLIVSIRVSRDFPELPYGAIGGHIVVITGLDADGNVLLNDPAFQTPTAGRLRVPIHIMNEIWLDAGGVTYVFDRPSQAQPSDTGEH